MGGRQKQRERRRQQREAAEATQSESSTEAPLTEEDDAMVTHLMQMATAAGMRVVNRDIVRQIWTSIRTTDEDKPWDVDASVLAVMQQAQVENCEEEAGIFSDAIFELLTSEVNDASVRVCEEMSGESPQEQVNEMVMVTKAGSWNKGGKTKAPGRTKASRTVAGQQARGHETSETLGMELSKLTKRPKPRTAQHIDEIVWSAARMKAEAEMKSEFDIKQTFEEYYQTMTDVGKTLLAQEIQRRTQRIHDYKATKIFQRTELRKKSA